MKTKQIYNVLKVAFFCTIFLFLFEVIFSISTVNDWFGGLIENSKNQIVAFTIIWILMFLQAWLIPLPAYVVLLASTHTNLLSQGFLNIQNTDIIFFCVTISAYICGFLLSYFIGYKWGAKAVEWAAGSKQDYDRWSKTLCKKGKWWYMLTVLLPFFPDDIICIVAGSLKFDFKFYCIVNVICRAIGLFCMIETLKFLGTWNSSGVPITAICWGIILLTLIILLVVFKSKLKKL